MITSGRSFLGTLAIALVAPAYGWGPSADVRSAPAVDIDLSAPAVDAGPGHRHGRWLQRRLDTARPGEVIDVPAGVHDGPFVVDVPVHLRGHGTAVLQGDGRTHVVAVRAPGVVVEGFHVRGSGLQLSADHAAIHVTGERAIIRDNRISESLHGVYVRGVDGVRVEGNTITGRTRTFEPVDPGAGSAGPGGSELCEVDLGQDRRGNGLHFWHSSGHTIERNVVRDARDGVYFSFVDDSVVRDNDIARVRYGLHYMYSDDNRFEGNVFRESAAGAALMYSTGIVLRDNVFAANRSHRAYGLLMHTVEHTDVLSNRIEGNTMGIFLENGYGNRFLDNRIAANHIGLHITDGSAENVFSGNTFTGNLHQVETDGPNRANHWALDGRGNHWQDARLLDLDGDGIGDLPHRELDLFGRLRRPFPAVGLLSGSPAERLLRFVHARLALPGISGVVDPAPLVKAARP
jgi:nitrous oxidase accessory protein